MVSISIVYPPCSRASLTLKSEAKTTHPIGGSGVVWLSRGPTELRDMYINGAILHSFVYLAILPVRIQLLSVPGSCAAPARGPPPLLQTPSDCREPTSFRRTSLSRPDVSFALSLLRRTQLHAGNLSSAKDFGHLKIANRFFVKTIRK